MDAPAMLTRKHVPEDVAPRNIVEGEGAGGQQQLHRDEKQHKPVLEKMKEKVNKIKNTLAGHGHGHGHDELVGDGESISNEEEEGDVALEREAATEKGGYIEDVEDKPVVMESDPEVHGAPIYESARIPAVQEVEGDGRPRVRLGDLGGTVVEDPAAPRSTAPAAREGEDIGTTPVVQQFESMTVSDDPPHVGAGKKDARAATGTTEFGKKLATTVDEKVAGVGTAVGVGKRDDERTEAMPVSDAGGEEWKDASAATDATDRAPSPGYTDKLKSFSAGTTEYGKQLATTVYEKVAGVGTAVAPSLRPQVGVGKPVVGRNEAILVPDAGAVERKDATDSASGVGYTDKIKSAATTVYEKVAGVGTAVVGKVPLATHSTGAVTPGVGAQQEDTSATVTPGAGGPGSGHDKGVTMMGYIAEKLRPGDEDRALSEAISGAVQRRKEDVGGTVAQRVPAPSQVMTKAREAVTSLTGGNRVSETVQPTTTGEDLKGGAAADAPVIRREEIGGVKLNTNTM
ncbi:low-temperature-induced 65 kDa protein-like [Phragmites australis]|uniref:low-temperature-induced 65 kDa protein-like n=1 Tax=Phragmites australis TaxID=29695 RepID=UPI002D780062|nr:low-temperature-induced 65 kDa protein-like [Phragmites australis]